MRCFPLPLRRLGWTLQAMLLMLAAPVLARVDANNGKDIQSAPRAAGPRMALLMGNGRYSEANGLRPLRYPANDVNLMKGVLESAQFKVITTIDTNLQAMKMAVRDLANEARKGNTSVVLFSFSGHGAQLDGHDFLVPLLEHQLEN